MFWIGHREVVTIKYVSNHNDYHGGLGKEEQCGGTPYILPLKHTHLILSMDRTPSVDLHRVLTPLNWSRSIVGRGVDGDVKSTTDSNTGAKTYRLKKQPGGDKNPVGESLFEPLPEYTERKHKELGAETFGCGVTVPNTALPANLRLNRDFELTLPVVNQRGDTVAEACGWHWTLYTTKDMPAEQFEALYELFKTQLSPCKVVGGAEAGSLHEEDDDFMPVDRHTYVSVLALEALATQTPIPSCSPSCFPTTFEHKTWNSTS